MIRSFFLKLLPRTFQVALDYEGTKRAILEVFMKDNRPKRVPEIVKESSLGITEPGPVYGHARRMTDEGLLRCTESHLEAEVVRLRFPTFIQAVIIQPLPELSRKRKRVRYYYTLTELGRQEAAKLSP